jgi:hypothetical protein
MLKLEWQSNGQETRNSIIVIGMFIIMRDAAYENVISIVWEHDSLQKE